MKNLLKVLVIGLLAGLLLSACAGPVNNLYGSWRSKDTTQPSLTLEFRQDGHMLESGQGMTQDILYEVTGDKKDTLLITVTKDTPASQASSLAFAISGDTLTLTISGQPQEFTRLK